MSHAARKEANAALKLSPSLDAYLVLGRLDLAANHMDDASREIGEALKIDPGQRNREGTEPADRGEVREESSNDGSEPCLSKCVDSSSVNASGLIAIGLICLSARATMRSAACR